MELNENESVPSSQLPKLQETNEENEPPIFVVVEEPPEPIGGIKAIQQKIVYLRKWLKGLDFRGKLLLVCM